METKKDKTVSVMKNKIIQETISSLQNEGLKFSVDTIAEKLKISKKTIYKYFPNKEALALAVYEDFYFENMKKVQMLLDGSRDGLRTKLLYLYYEMKKMTRSDIFNKFRLNDVILSYAESQNNAVWEKISSVIVSGKSSEDAKVLKVIIDGAFEKLISMHGAPAPVIKRLEILL